MNSRLKKILLLLLATVLLVGVARVQRVLNVDRERLGLTRIAPLENAPPVLAFTTVALGGFRGLIANALWIRANDLQDEDKFFEAAQLADWITKLEPHFVQVWLVQAWNMAYNISVKFKDFDDRWRWVQRGIALLRDDGLRFNPNETLIFRELAWFFQHKMGANLDDANMRYKQEWLKEMSEVFAKKAPDLEELINPQTDDARRRSQLLTSKYKLDPQFMKQVDERYGPLEWRLPESHAIYWAARGLENARENPTKIKPDDLIQLRRAIYQSMQLSFQRGRLAANNFAKSFEFGPNLEIIPNVSAAYEQAIQEDVPNRDHIAKAHRNFLRDAVYFLYENNRLADSAKWYRYLGEKYPDKFLIDGNTNSFPRNLTLNDYAVARIVEDVGETSRDRVKAAIEGMLIRAYVDLVTGQPDRSAGYRLKARMLRDSYMSNIKGSDERIGLPSVEDIEKEMLGRLLDPTTAMMPFEMRAILRTELRMPPEIAVPAASTNAPAGGTNAPAVPLSK
jgi:hypothetical protein